MGGSDYPLSNFFVAGPMLLPDAPSYVIRAADDHLFNQILEGQSCSIFAPPQMGKSSLMVRTSQRLRDRGFVTAMVYLSGLRLSGDLEQGYLGLASRLAVQLKLSLRVDDWWKEQAAGRPAARFTDFLQQLLAEVRGPVVIFIDEVDHDYNREFLQDFLTTLRSIHDARSTKSDFQLLTFVILGNAVPADLIKDHGRSPFPVWQRVELPEFSREEAQILAQVLEDLYPEHAAAIFDRIFYWTGGHPYLTQKMCQNVVRMGNRRLQEDRVNEWVDRIVDTTFLLSSAREELNLQATRQRIENAPRPLLRLYGQVHRGKQVAEDPRRLDQERLKMMGLLRADQRRLHVRNPIYIHVFKPELMKSQTAINWLRPVAIVLIVLLLGLAGVATVSAFQQRQRAAANQAQTSIENFHSDTSMPGRLNNLAALFDIPAYVPEARRLFYEELSPEEQLALFQPADPRSVDKQLITVAKGIYTSSELPLDEAGNALLETIVQALRQLDYGGSPGVVDLELEITQWLRGRVYQAEGQYRQAVDAYNLAISLNDNNPATHFERGLAYGQRQEPDLALADFVATLNLGADWQGRVQQALVNQADLYNALWSKPGGYQKLVALVPTPTVTPTPTDIPTQTPTPAPTQPPTPVPFTPTPKPTTTPTVPPTPVRVSAPTATPTPSLTGANLVLLSPLSLDNPVFGPAEFQWQWPGELPPDYGFEVRVWRPGEQPAGVHNAVLDNQNGVIKKIGDNRYQLNVNIGEAAGIKGRSGEYLWTVVLVQISPEYLDLEEQAEPARLRFETGGGGGGGGGKGNDGDGGGGGGGGGGVVIN